jgi:protein-L-isoaspartate(D-aspartate) O-methyltransferase
MNIELARFNMIEQQIRPWQVLDPAVLELLSVVKREDFVPARHRMLAFVDTQVPLSDEPGGPCMLEPKVEARLLQELRVNRNDRILEIGCGTGFMAALLAHLGREVTSVELRADWAQAARRNLERAGLSRVRVVHGDASRELPDGGPWDVILLSGSVAEVPKSLLNQLKVGGRLAGIFGTGPIMRARLFTRVGETSWSDVDLFDTMAPRLSGFSEPSRFQF